MKRKSGPQKQGLLIAMWLLLLLLLLAAVMGLDGARPGDGRVGVTDTISLNPPLVASLHCRPVTGILGAWSIWNSAIALDWTTQIVLRGMSVEAV